MGIGVSRVRYNGDITKEEGVVLVSDKDLVFTTPASPDPPKSCWHSRVAVLIHLDLQSAKNHGPISKNVARV